MASFDVVVIGGGSAGLTAAMAAIEQGVKVALVEQSGRYGGTCRYVGCVPSKTLLHTAHTLYALRHELPKLGLPAVDIEWDFRQVMQHKDDIVLRVGGDDEYDAPKQFYEAGGQTFTGAASFRSRNELEVGDEVLQADRFIIATGSRPRIPEIEGIADVGYLTWESVFDLTELPRSMIIIGGGPLAVEFAQMFQRFGSNVTVLEAADQLVPQADNDVALALQAMLEAEGVQVRLGVEIQSVRRDGDQRTVMLGGQPTTQLRADQLMVATGTQPNTETLKLDRAGVELTEKGSIKVDQQLRTTANGIYACGDVATKYQFTHIAEYEAKIAVANAIADAATTIDERVVPWAVYTEPPLAHVGLTEQEARDQGIEIVTACVEVANIERSILVEQQVGLIKAIARRDSGELLGVDLLSARADDLIHEAALAIRMRLSIRDIAQTIHAYPTFSQGLSEVAQQLAAQLDQA